MYFRSKKSKKRSLHFSHASFIGIKLEFISVAKIPKKEG